MIFAHVGQIVNIKNAVGNNMNPENPDINLTITEILIRLTAIEKILLDKKIVTEEELIDQINKLSESLVTAIKNASQN